MLHYVVKTGLILIKKINQTPPSPNTSVMISKKTSVIKIKEIVIIVHHRTILERACLLPALLALRSVVTIILTLDILEDRLHHFDLLLPVLLVHLDLLLEHLLLGGAVAASETVPKGGVLAIVVVEGQVVNRVARGAIDDGVVGNVLAVVNQNGPEVDKDEQADIGKLLERENEGEDVVRQALGVAVKRVEGVAGEGGGHDPLVVRLVKVLVDPGVVKAAMDPVDGEVGKQEEERELEPIVPGRGGFLELVVELTEASNFEEHERGGHQSHTRHGRVGLLDLEPDLVLEELGMLKCLFVEDEEVGETSKDEIIEKTEEPVCAHVSVVWSRVAISKGTGECANHNIRNRETPWRYMLSLAQALPHAACDGCNE